MATLMQKDVLLEMVAAIRGRIFYNRASINSEELEIDRKSLSKKREYFYSNFPEDLDYQTELAHLQQLKLKYEE